MSHTEYRAVVTCTFDPCSYCRRPAESMPQTKRCSTYDEALSHGQGMSNNVYGASVHKVSVESRVVSDWTATGAVPVPKNDSRWRDLDNGSSEVARSFSFHTDANGDI